MIRALVICTFHHDGQILVFEGYDKVKEQTFYRPLGGSIEFGEYSQETIVREMKEELNAEITNLKFLGSLENIFVFNGIKGHEIVLVYNGSFADPSFYLKPELEGIEDNGFPFKASWKPIELFRGIKAPPLYPDGLLELIKVEHQ